MKFKDLVTVVADEKELSVLFPGERESAADVYRRWIVEGAARDDFRYIAMGSDGEFRPMASLEPEELEKRFDFLWLGEEFDPDGFDKLMNLEVREGYWVYEYITCLNLDEFRYFDTLEKAEEFYESERFEDNSLVYDMRLLYVSETKKECLKRKEMSS